VELALNLAWAIAAAAVFGGVYRSVRAGKIRISMSAAMIMAVLIVFVLLPVISVTDDFLEAQQAALPLSGQTWRVAAEALGNGLDPLVAVAVYLLLLMCFLIAVSAADFDQWSVRPLPSRLIRSQRLRPPPACAAL
jgi:hypothetical protein